MSTIQNTYPLFLVHWNLARKQYNNLYLIEEDEIGCDEYLIHCITTTNLEDCEFMIREANSFHGREWARIKNIGNYNCIGVTTSGQRVFHFMSRGLDLEEYIHTIRFIRTICNRNSLWHLQNSQVI